MSLIFIPLYIKFTGIESWGLMGLQRQVLLNAINMVANTLRGIGAVLLLWLVSLTIQAYFLWQIVAANKAGDGMSSNTLITVL
jgi:hypothetical protein